MGVRHDTYDIRLLWLRDHHEGRWITFPWRLLSTTATPFGELAWDHEVRNLRERGGPVTEDAVASSLLARPRRSTEPTSSCGASLQSLLCIDSYAEKTLHPTL
ncbi:hypothetical protein [Streptomyces sp. NPDC002324]